MLQPKMGGSTFFMQIHRDDTYCRFRLSALVFFWGNVGFAFCYLLGWDAQQCGKALAGFDTTSSQIRIPTLYSGFLRQLMA